MKEVEGTVNQLVCSKSREERLKKRNLRLEKNMVALKASNRLEIARYVTPNQ